MLNTIKKCESNTIKGVIKIRLHKQNTKYNYKKNESDTTCPLCKTENITEHIMVCQEGNNIYNLLDEMKRTGKKLLQYTRIIKKIEKNQNNKKVQKEDIQQKVEII